MQNEQVPAQNLEQKLLSTRYSVIDQMFNVNESLQKQKLKRRLSKQKIEQMHKKILLLEIKEKQTNTQARRYQHKLQKLQNSQDLATYLFQLKDINFRKKEQQLEEKRQFCTSMRVGLAERKQKSLSFFEKRKLLRVKKIKQDNFQQFREKQRRSEMDINLRRNNKEKIKEHQAIAKQRLKRYGEFKLAQAKYNYDIKREQQAIKQQKLVQQLAKFRNQARDQEKIYRKTQLLHRQTRQAESFYLTNND